MRPHPALGYLLVLLPLLPPAARGAAPLPPNPLHPLQAKIDAALARVSPSVVSLWYGEPRRHVSGAILTADGLVATCSHLARKAGEPVEVRLADGRKVAGKVLARLGDGRKGLAGRDLALVQIGAAGPWPAVEVGRADALTPDDPILAAGFPVTELYGRPDELPCYVRLGRLLTRPASGRVTPGELTTTIRSVGGDSGGPLFDLRGRLVGVASSGELDGTQTRYTSVDVLMRAWAQLAPGRPAPPVVGGRPAAPVADTAAVAAAVRAVRPAVVEVRCDDRWAAVGSVVGPGLVLTKASELGGGISVVLADDTVAGADVAATDPARDLALLRLWSRDLARGIDPVSWAGVNDLHAGAVVAAATPPDFVPPVGVVCFPARAVPGLPGILPVDVKDAPGGVEVTGAYPGLVTRWLRPPPFPLQKGDVLTHVAGVAVADRQAFLALNFRGKQIGRHPRVAGERLTVTYRRGKKTAEEAAHLRNQASARGQMVRPSSYRYTGFARALAADLAARPEHCGAPVVDARGRAVGVLIARAPFIESLLLPADEVKASLEAMRRRADEKKGGRP